jgi:hypothetical protein
VTLIATADTKTRATLHGTNPQGKRHQEQM